MTERSDIQRLRMIVRGAVQGVGFRPFVYRLATELNLRGWVRNSSRGVVIEVEGEPAALERFRLDLERRKPPRASLQGIEAAQLDPAGHAAFEILPSDPAGEQEAFVLPDIATCPDCLREIFDPGDRRHGYPFTNCTNCGPRFTIIHALPYDRAQTTMRHFTMCPACRAEYEAPADRRFHAQPNACPVCGPRLQLWERDGGVRAEGAAALAEAAQAVRERRIVAMKGLGGFQLIVAAGSATAVGELRRRKAREEKPLACMFPSLDRVRATCEVSPQEERLLLSPEAPIVLLRRGHMSQAAGIAAAVAPGNPHLGVMLPYTPLHHLLLADLGFPIVATSGNRSEEPICTDEREALERLGEIADLFLVHDRPIARHADDSIVRICAERELVLRRARGYAPLPIRLAHAVPPVLAVGAHLKNTVALAAGRNAFVSQHIGDLQTPQAYHAFTRAIGDLGRLFDLAPGAVACDLHPDYLSTRYARESGLPCIPVQHHLAHALACMAENELAPPVLAVSWDGTGYGPDGTVWGGEFLRIAEEGFERAAHLRTFRLPGGEQAVREPRRAALGVLWEILGDELCAREDLDPVRSFSPGERRVLCAMLRKGLNSHVTSSAGRLFDAVAALLGLHQTTRFEGQAAMALEFAALEAEGITEAYDFAQLPRDDTRPAWILDWEPLVHALLADHAAHVPRRCCARKFHHALAGMIAGVARACGLERVVLSGGCFQNALLTEITVEHLRAAGFHPYWHQRVPPNDGGIALGQIAAVLRSAPFSN